MCAGQCSVCKVIDRVRCRSRGVWGRLSEGVVKCIFCGVGGLMFPLFVLSTGSTYIL